MNYPVWYIPAVGGAVVISIVAILHVVVSHFAIGGGLWLVLTEKKAYREKKDVILDYVKAHAKFFMLLTLVFGAVTGVGIWFTISLISPDATSFLIHTFVFVWAIEWVFFVIEIVSAFLYFYTFKKIREKIHLLIGWVYFGAAAASLFVINAILSFMMTPGKWLETGNFWDAVFNPTFWSSSIFRLFLCLALAGSYALLTAARKLTGETKKTMVKYNGKWIIFSLAGMIPALLWYYFSIPKPVQQGLAGASNIMHTSFLYLVISLGLFLLLVFLFTLWKSGTLTFSRAMVTLVVLFIFFGAFEFIREAGRKPFIITDYMYVTGIRVSQQEELKGKPFLEHAKWVATAAGENELIAGENLFRLQCYACHTTGIKNNIFPAIKDWDQRKIIRGIGSLSGMTSFMPAFLGSEAEKTALGKWLYSVSHRGMPPEELHAPGDSPPLPKGEVVFEDYCASCHEIDGDNAIRPLMKEYAGMEAMLKMLGELEQLNEEMPPFEGTPEEKKVLAEYLLELSRREK